jgi:8-oxo-dGTP pyrophosphatase MutT (NUDIX family)
MSFGLICYRLRSDHKPEYLLVQRKDSLAFMEFIRGKFEPGNTAYIQSLLSFMTHAERRSLLERSFNDLWNQVWYQAFIPRHTQEYFDARTKFEALQRNGSMEAMLGASRSEFAEPEWGFPKGRRRLREEDVDCAVREFCEETGFTRSDVELLPGSVPYEEVFYGTNHVLYRHVYYCARVCRNADRPVGVDPTNLNQAREVRQVRWFSAEEVLRCIRGHNTERRALFANAHAEIGRYVGEAAAPPPPPPPIRCV